MNTTTAGYTKNMTVPLLDVPAASQPGSVDDAGRQVQVVDASFRFERCL